MDKMFDNTDKMLHNVDKLEENAQDTKESRLFLDWAGAHYLEQRDKMERFCSNKDYRFDEDVFSDTIVKVYDRVRRFPLKDMSDKGIEDYVFKAFKQNLKRESEYCRNSRRDWNVRDEEIEGLYEKWCNDTRKEEREKLMSDLWKDFAALYLIAKVEDNFDEEHFHLFKIKTLSRHMSYDKLRKVTHVKKCRQKVAEVYQWLKENVKREEVEQAFQIMYNDIL